MGQGALGRSLILRGESNNLDFCYISELVKDFFSKALGLQ